MLSPECHWLHVLPAFGKINLFEFFFFSPFRPILRNTNFRDTKNGSRKYVHIFKTVCKLRLKRDGFLAYKIDEKMHSTLVTLFPYCFDRIRNKWKLKNTKQTKYTYMCLSTSLMYNERIVTVTDSPLPLSRQ